MVTTVRRVIEDGDQAVEVRSLRRTFKGGVEAVHGIDLGLPAGEVFGLLGPNGAGKTTTVRMLTPPSLHSTPAPPAWPGRHHRRSGPGPPTHRLHSRRPGSTPSRPAPSCSAPGPALRPRRRRAAPGPSELLSCFGLTEAAGRRTKTYSGGMRRRLDLARALVARPEVVFLDEPTTGLDPASRADLWESSRGTAPDGTTVLLTTQYLEEADQLADRVAILAGGRIARRGNPVGAQGDMGYDRRQGPACRRRSDRGGGRRGCRGLGGWSPKRMRSPSTSRTAPARSPRSCAALMAPRSGSGRSRSRGRRLTTCSCGRPGAGSRAPRRNRKRRRKGRMTETLLLGRRAVREIVRYPEATIPALFIPLFFLAVNIGQVSETFPDTTPFS